MGSDHTRSVWLHPQIIKEIKLKLHLECGETLLNGYINISSVPVHPDKIGENDNVSIGQFSNLDPIINNDSCTEILFRPYLNTIKPEEIGGILNHWKNKISNGGMIKFNFIDIVRVSKSVAFGDMSSLNDVHNAIFGEGYVYKSIISLDVLKAALEDSGLYVNRMTAHDHIVTLEVKK